MNEVVPFFESVSYIHVRKVAATFFRQAPWKFQLVTRPVNHVPMWTGTAFQTSLVVAVSLPPPQLMPSCIIAICTSVVTSATDSTVVSPFKIIIPTIHVVFYSMSPMHMLPKIKELN